MPVDQALRLVAAVLVVLAVLEIVGLAELMYLRRELEGLQEVIRVAQER